ncbi:MAG: hypothetical protein K8963_09380 [Proteobacteria bacterium]|nr:hypothetical protein [Pseudomonadota bacterium]
MQSANNQPAQSQRRGWAGVWLTALAETDWSCRADDDDAPLTCLRCAGLRARCDSGRSTIRPRMAIDEINTPGERWGAPEWLADLTLSIWR